MLATGYRHGAIFLEETKKIRSRAERRYSEERPPGHTKKATPGDCKIWKQCLDLLSGHDVVFVSQDKDFQSRHGKLHPQLDAEVKEVGAGRSLRLYSKMKLLPGEMKSEIGSIPDDAIFHLIYERISKIAVPPPRKICWLTQTLPMTNFLMVRMQSTGKMVRFFQVLTTQSVK